MTTGTMTIYLTPSLIKVTTGAVTKSGIATFTLPSFFQGTDITGARLLYRRSSSGGDESINVRFYSGEKQSYSNERLFDRIRNNGETEIEILFAYYRYGGTGSCTWSDIRVELDYALNESDLKGVINVSNQGSVFYQIDKNSFAKNETAAVTLAIVPANDIQSVDFKIAINNSPAQNEVTSNEYSIFAASGSTTICSFNVNCNSCDFSGSTTAYFAIALKENDTGTTSTSNYVASGVTLLSSRPAPNITNVAWTSGTLIQDVTDLTCTVTYTLDSHATLRNCAVTINGNTYTNTSGGVISVGPVNAYGSVSYTATVTDSFGNSDTETGSITIAAYSKPKLTSLVVSRCKEENNQYVLDDEGTIAYIQYTGTVQVISGGNAWTAKAGFTDGTNEYISNGNIDSGTGSSVGTLSYSNGVKAYTNTTPPALVSGGLASSRDWTVSITITDHYSSATYVATLNKAGGIFSIEEYGVAVGQRSSGTSNQTKFESNYKSYFYKEVEIDNVLTVNVPTGSSVAINGNVDIDGTLGLNGGSSFLGDVNITCSENPMTIDGRLEIDGGLEVNGAEYGEDTGWSTSLITLNTNDVHDTTSTLKIRKKDGVVYIAGGVYLKTDFSSGSSSSKTVGTLNSNVYPDTTHHMSIVLSGEKKFIRCVIDSSLGTMTLYNYCGYAISKDTVFIPLNTTYIAAEPANNNP